MWKTLTRLSDWYPFSDLRILKDEKISVREPCLQYLWGRRNSRCYEITETIYTLVLLLSLNSFSTLDRRKSPATSFFNLCFSSKNVEKAGAWKIMNKNVILKMQVEIVQCTSCSLTSRKFKAIGSSFSRRPYSTTHWPTSFTTFCFVVRMYEAFSWSEPSESSAWYVHWWLRGIKTLYKLCLLLSSSPCIVIDHRRILVLQCFTQLAGGHEHFVGE